MRCQKPVVGIPCANLPGPRKGDVSDLPLVLVHGSSHGAWCWDDVLPLAPKGSIAVDLPHRGGQQGPMRPTLDQYATHVLASAHDAGLERFVVVGHSMAGMLLPLVAHEDPAGVGGCIYVSALVAHPGECAFTTASPRVGPVLRAAAKVSRAKVASPGRLGTRLLCNDLPVATRAGVRDKLCAEPLSVVTERVDTTCLDVPKVPTAYVHLLRDRTVPLRRQRALADRLGEHCQRAEIDAAHDVMLSRPRELAGVLTVLSRALTA